MNILRFLFSIKNRDVLHKEITILGIRFKIRRKLQDRKFHADLPIQPNKIVFNSVFGAYQCSPKYIAEEIRRQGLPYDLVWIVNMNILKYIDSFPKGIRLVMRNSSEAIKELATAKIWVENDRKLKELRKGFRKRPGQVYINTWHGSLGIKKTGAQRNDMKRKERILCETDSAQVDYMLSNAQYTTDFYKEIFWGYGKSVECGCPRNDIFFSPQQQDIRLKVCTQLGISPEKKILLYAPTWRDDKSTACFSLNYAQALAALQERFGGDWLIIVRLHSRMTSLGQSFFPPDTPTVDATYYPDMQELLVSADAVITDYSSCIYDYMLTRRPGFIYAPDMKNYATNRGLCYPLEETPFPLAADNEALENNIRRFDERLYKEQVDAFLRGKGSIDDGHAAERAVELIKNIIDGKA